jgi:hypothetical protein
MRIMVVGLFTLDAVAFSSFASAVEENWNDGVLFIQEELTPVEGHGVFKIIFGLEPGKCTDEMTAVSEVLIMREGTLIQTYLNKGDVARNKGDEWYQANGTKVVVCNKSAAKAV